MRRNEDTFIKWKREGLLNTKISYLRGASSNFYSQKRMASDLGITEATFISLKNKHKEIRDALAYGDEILKADVMSALKKRAVGYVSVTKVRSMKRDGGGRDYQAVQEVEKEFPPDVDAIKYYGSDKPDTRFGLHIKEVTDVLKKTDFNGYKEAQCIKALVIPGVAQETSRKVIDNLTLEAKKFGFGGIGVYKIVNGAVESSLAKFATPEQLKELVNKVEAKENDIILVLAGKHDPVCFALGALRSQYARKLCYIKPNT